jgi:hypothetical protein
MEDLVQSYFTFRSPFTINLKEVYNENFIGLCIACSIRPIPLDKPYVFAK